MSWLLIIVLVNLNYQIGVHINYARSRMPVLVCNLQSEYGCHQTRSQGGQRGQCHPNSKVFRLIKYLKYKRKEYFSADQQNCLKERILLQLLVEYKLVSWPFVINDPQVKPIGETRFSQLLLVYPLAVSGLIVTPASFQDHRKLLLDSRECYNYNLSLFPVSA